MSEELLQQILIELKDLKTGQQNLEVGQQKLETSQQKLEAGQLRLEASQQNLEAGQQKLEASQQKLEAGQLRLETEQQKLEAGQLRLEASQQNLEAGQLRLEIEQKSMKNDIADIKQNMATKEDVALLPSIQQAVSEAGQALARIEDAQERIERNQIQHAKILESLSMRFFEHDSDLRELKRIK
ncbi:hypothetical protein J4772_16930 [Cohnella sp. LGH]|uniref:hypothetical protein n=1 Tax=Cohnella sp. LGH TaxID=1619153 RepID=UPI001ADAA772|nr:hypothetical protein [Cohnella sp. LGH]QTH45961.1 hypothetical protein J4772_16930 [Cohnella sp. LGH]